MGPDYDSETGIESITTATSIAEEGSTTISESSSTLTTTISQETSTEVTSTASETSQTGCLKRYSCSGVNAAKYTCGSSSSEFEIPCPVGCLPISQGTINICF